MEQAAEPMTTSRRKLLGAGIATTGAAYVAPQILSTAVAGAQTETCYAFKIEASGIEDESDLNDRSCSDAFNAAFATAGAGKTGILGAAPASAYTVTFGGVGANNATITAGANCTFLFAGFKAADSCFWNNNMRDGSPGPGFQDDGVTISADGKTVLIESEEAAISHMVFLVCCVGSPV